MEGGVLRVGEHRLQLFCRKLLCLAGRHALSVHLLRQRLRAQQHAAALARKHRRGIDLLERGARADGLLPLARSVPNGENAVRLRHVERPRLALRRDPVRVLDVHICVQALISAQQHRRGLFARGRALGIKVVLVHARPDAHAVGKGDVAAVGRAVGKGAVFPDVRRQAGEAQRIALHRLRVRVGDDAREHAVAQCAYGHRRHLLARHGVVRTALAAAGEDVVRRGGLNGAVVPLLRILIVRKAALLGRDGLPSHQPAQRRGVGRARHLLPKAELAVPHALEQVILPALRDAARRPVLVRHVGIAGLVRRRDRRRHRQHGEQQRQRAF